MQIAFADDKGKVLPATSLELLQNVSATPAVAQGFYQQFLLALIQDIFAVLTDRLHKSGFKMHATLLRNMFHLVKEVSGGGGRRVDGR